MSDDSSGEKTEQPTPKKIRDAREEGQVAYSKDFTHTLLFASLFGYMLFNGRGIIESLGRLLLLPVSLLQLEFHQAANSLIIEAAFEGMLVLLPFVLIVLVMGIFGDTLQVGIMLAFKAIKPSGKKLDIIGNLQNTFSAKNLVEFLKSTLKVIILSVLLWWVIGDQLSELMTIPLAGLEGMGHSAGVLLRNLTFSVALVYAVIAVADLLWQRHAHRKELMMTKDEVQREYKEMEGNPEIKQQRKHLHQEMLMQDAVENTRNASVLITNPTHLAIALRYDEGDTPLPVVLAKGSGALAERMMAAARAAEVPIVQNIPLAHALMNQADVDQYIPSELIEPVAQVLRLLREFGDAQEKP